MRFKLRFAAPDAACARRRLPALALAIPLALLAGCTGRTELRLFQPEAPLSQRELDLETKLAEFAPRSAGREYLVEFPLPGSTIGVIAFRTYVLTPAPLGKFTLGPGADQARAFLIQEVGVLAGKTVFTEGQVEVSRDLLNPSRVRVKLDLIAGGGIRLSGTANPSEGTSLIRPFRRVRAADVALAENAAASQAADSQPASSDSTASQSAPAARAP